MSDTTTIAAIATPMGQAGVGIIRLSGPRSLEIASKLFIPGPRFKGFQGYRLHYGWIQNKRSETIDEVLLSYMPAPYSYTREEVVEINCHGGPAVLEAALEALYDSGAEPAQPGEFTKRAFLNNRLDLTQAEAIQELINAPTQSGAFLAGNKLQGHLKNKVESLRQGLEDLKKQLCLAVDFPEEDLECLPPEILRDRVLECLQEIERLISSYEHSRVYREGALVVLAGRVNAGKSSLMNALLGRERAIVTSVPGTTRDYLEEGINLDGLPVRLVDTAGRRESPDEIELMGLETSRDLINSAELCVLVLDSTLEPSSEDWAVLEEVGPDKILVAANKWDLLSHTPSWVEDFTPRGLEVLPVSAKHDQGLEELSHRIRTRILQKHQVEAPSHMAPNLRQKNALEKARAELENLAREAVQGVPYDLLGTSLDFACAQLDEITGQIVTEDILEDIFSNFCIGK